MGRASCLFRWLWRTVWIALPALLSGQPTFVNIGRQQGLGGIKPTCVFQDSHGFMWVGTWGGLFRFDGRACKLFEHQPGDSTSLPSNFIAYHGFCDDPDGNLWLATFDAGFARFDCRTERFEAFRKTPSGVSLEALNGICADGLGGCWLATRGNGLIHVDSKTVDFQVISLKNALPGLPSGADRLTDVCVARDGQIWAATHAGLAERSPDGQIRFHVPGDGRDGKLSSSYVVDVYEDRRNRLWACTDKGLNLRVGSDSFRVFLPEPTNPNSSANRTQRIFEDREGQFWLGTEAGLFRFDPEQAAFEAIRHDPLNPNAIAKGGIHGIFEDIRGNLWFVADGGLSLMDKRVARLRAADFPDLRPLLPDLNTLYNGPHFAIAGGRIWLACEKGLFHFQPGEAAQNFFAPQHPVFSKNGVPSAGMNFTALFADSREQLWAGTAERAFFKIDPQSLRVLQVYQKETKAVSSSKMAVGARNTAFAEDKTGQMWLGFLGSLSRFDPSTGEFQQFFSDKKRPASISSNNINHLLSDRAGNLWLATSNGLNLLTASELEKTPSNAESLCFIRFQHNPRDPNSLTNDHARVVFQDSRDRIWVGTDVGLNLRLPDGRWRRFFRKDGLPENHITGIAEDGAGKIWLSTPSLGLARLDPETGFIERLARSDGLDTERFPTAACLRLPDGRLLAAGIGGFNVFNPETLDFRSDSAPLHFVELKLFNRPVLPGDASGLLAQTLHLTREIFFDFGQNVFSVEFAALNFSAPEKQVYRYRLLPFHAEWQYIGDRREATFTNLAPGRYELRVETSANGHDWSGRSLWLTVRAPWWRAWWASLLFVLAVGGLLFGLRKFELRRKLARAETSRLRELDVFKTRFYINITHEFRTPLTVILGMVEQLRKRAAAGQNEGLAMIARNAKGLLRLVNQMLELSKLESGALPVRLAREDAILFLRYIAESFRSMAEQKGLQIDFQSVASGFVVDFDKEKLEAIVQNLLSNALKFTPAGGRICLSVAHDEALRRLKIEVADNGPGIAPADLPHVFDRFFRAENSGSDELETEGFGVGLALSKELAQLLGGEIQARSVPGEGSIFTLWLPAAGGRVVVLEEHALPTATAVLEKNVRQGARFPPNENAEKTPLRLLIVEDNPDVSRYMAAVLRPKFSLQFASDGAAGIEIALETVPDLIISDVLMPRKTGLELCRTLKNDPRTSHIPIVLLTAKADRSSRLEGLETGADEYLAKPFDEAELLLRVEKLVELRRRLQERYARVEDISKAAQFEPLNREDLFLRKIAQIVAENMADEAFDMPQLCAALHMSRSNLFRKMKALTGQSVTQFILARRLEKAKELLLASEMNVMEVCYAVGFASPNYFSRAFRERFGMPPGEARKE